MAVSGSFGVLGERRDSRERLPEAAFRVSRNPRCPDCSVELVAWVSPDGEISGWDHPAPVCLPVRRRARANFAAMLGILALIGLGFGFVWFFR